jgi:hypothetical protein
LGITHSLDVYSITPRKAACFNLPALPAQQLKEQMPGGVWLDIEPEVR